MSPLIGGDTKGLSSSADNDDDQTHSEVTSVSAASGTRLNSAWHPPFNGRVKDEYKYGRTGKY